MFGKNENGGEEDRAGESADDLLCNGPVRIVCLQNIHQSRIMIGRRMA